MTKILVAKDKVLVVMDTCDYKPRSRFGQGAKENQSPKTPRGMYNHPYNCISLANVGIFHPLISRRTMGLKIRLLKILGTIF
jgi:hypothetical protein